jgi:hypothetical protein
MGSKDILKKRSEWRSVDTVEAFLALDLSEVFQLEDIIMDIAEQEHHQQKPTSVSQCSWFSIPVISLVLSIVFLNFDSLVESCGEIKKILFIGSCPSDSTFNWGRVGCSQWKFLKFLLCAANTEKHYFSIFTLSFSFSI